MTQEAKKGDKMRQVVIPIAILVLGLGAVFFYARNLFKKPEAPAEAKAPEEFTLQQEAAADELEFFGSLEANKESNLAAKTSGRIAQLMVKEGDPIRKGELLAFLHPDQNAINLNNSQLNSDNFEIFRSNQANFFDRQVRIAKENLNVAKDEKDYDEKYNRNHLDVSKKAVDQAEAELRAAQKERDAQKKFLAQQSDNLSGDVRLAGQDVTDTRIFAPFNGVVLAKFLEEGEVVSVGDPVISVGEISSYKVVVDVPDYLNNRLYVGLGAKVILDGVPGEQTATVTVIHPLVDVTAKKVQVEVTLNSIPTNAKVGMYARVSIKFPPRTAFFVPNRFVFAGFEGPYVILADGEKRSIQRLGERDGESEINFDGIAAGVNIRRQ